MIVTGVVCCDAKQLPTASGSAKVELIRPNKFHFSSRIWQKLPYFPRAAILEATGTQAGRIWIAPFQPGLATSATTLFASAYSVGYGAIIPAPGEWFAYYDSADTLEVSIKETACTVPLNGYSAATHGTPVSVTTADTSILAANNARRYLCIVNDGTVTVYVMFGAAATVSGIPLYPGGSYEMLEHELHRGTVRGITAAGTGTINVLEGV